MFAKLGRIVTKHYKIIILIWVIAVIAAVPAVLKMSEVIVYTETAFAPSGVESVKADEIVAREFPRMNGTSAVLVVKAGDVRDTAIRDYIFELNKTILNDPDIKYTTNVTSIYSVCLTMVKAFTTQTAFLIYGDPYAYVYSWNYLVFMNATWQNLTLPMVNYIANQTSWETYIYPQLVNLDLSQENIAFIFGYHNSFYLNWSSSFIAQPNMSDPSPLIRAQNIIFNATTGMGIYTYYTTFLPNSREIAEFFNLTTWNSDNKITDYALNTVKNLPLTQLLASFPQELQPQLSPIYSQFISPDNKTMLISIDFSEKSSAIKGCIPQIRNDAKQVANNLGILDNVELYVTGEPAFDHDIQEETFKDIERIDPISIGLIILIIGLFFASVLSPLIPLGAIGISIIAAFACVFLIGTFVAHVYFIILTFLPMSMLGAGCDYGIFLMSRFYEERKKGKSKEEAVETAVTWAGESIATSGATVIISFGAMSLASFGMIKTLGLTVMLGIAIALIAALTFVPSILMLLGDKLFWPRKLLKDNNGEVIPNRKSRISYYRKSARFTVKHAKLIVIVALLVTVPATIGALSFPGSHDFIAQTPKNMESRAGFDAMAEGFGQGALSFTKTLIVVQFNDKITDGNTFNQTILEAISLLENKTAQLSGISKVYGPTRYDGRPFNYSQLNDPNIPAYQRSQLVQNVLNFIGSSKNTALILVELSYEPYTNEALDAVGMLRNEIKELRNANSDIALNEAEVYVGGVTASTRDITAIVDADFVNMLIMVMVGVFIVLMFALGSIFTPLRLILTITLSIAWTLAIVNLVFQVWLGIPMIWMIPMILFILMMGLGMDYDIFLVTRIREGVIKGMSDEEAIEHAVERTGGIISACGFVMAGALGSLMLSTMPMLQQFGLALFAVVLLDAMFVRIYLVPAIMMLLKKYNWWAPKRIRRVPEREDKLVNC